MKHILITGTGRAGTTLLVELFTTLGFDTGFSLDELRAKIDPIARAGLEPNPRKDKLHHVIKLPGRADAIRQLTDRPGFSIEAAIVPMRDIYEAAESRRNVHRLAERAGKNAMKQPGSLWGTSNPDEQEAALALSFYDCIQTIMAAEAPLYFLEFPRYSEDATYLYRALRPVFSAYDKTEAEVALALAAVRRPELINTFGPTRDTARKPQQVREAPRFRDKALALFRS